jgi:hypothetical protein
VAWLVPVHGEGRSSARQGTDVAELGGAGAELLEFVVLRGES